MPERESRPEFCCTPEGDLKPRIAPAYTVEGTVEHGILEESERYFHERDEALRYGLVKRLVQWVMDTDANAFFDEVAQSGPGVLTSRHGIRSYVSTLRRDTVENCLGEEVQTLHDYLMTIEEVLPSQYHLRYRMLLNSTESPRQDPYDIDSRVERESRIASWLRTHQAFDA